MGLISPSDTANYNGTLPLIPFDPTGAAALLRQGGWRRAAGPTAGWFRPGNALSGVQGAFWAGTAALAAAVLSLALSPVLRASLIENIRHGTRWT